MTTIQDSYGDTTGFLPDEKAVRSFRTPVVDLLAASAVYNFNIPDVLGKKFLNCSFIAYFHILTRTGTVATPASVAVAQNGVMIGAAAASLPAASLNFLSPVFQIAVNSINTQLVSTSSPIQMLIITPATGATVLTGYFEIIGLYE